MEENKTVINEQETILGKKVKDKATGLIGVATAHTIYLAASPKVCMEWLYKGEIKCDWLDEARLEVIE